MTMLYPEEFWATTYGFGAKVYDATGRLLRSVVACDPDTGEVITHDMPLVAHVWHRLLWSRTGPRGPFRWRFGPYLHPPGYGCLDRRHGFWPAPLRLVPKPAPPATWPAGPICDSQRYIVGNGDRDELLP